MASESLKNVFPYFHSKCAKFSQKPQVGKYILLLFCKMEGSLLKLVFINEAIFLEWEQTQI